MQNSQKPDRKLEKFACFSTECGYSFGIQAHAIEIIYK
jgi:hypothetical protein